MILPIISTPNPPSGGIFQKGDTLSWDLAEEIFQEGDSNPHPLDKKYPHICFECKRDLKFDELFLANRRGSGMGMVNFDIPLYKRLKKLWVAKVVEFYCCNCYKLQIIW